MNAHELIDALISAATVKESHRNWHGETQIGTPKLAGARKALEDYIAELEQSCDHVSSLREYNEKHAK